MVKPEFFRVNYFRVYCVQNKTKSTSQWTSCPNPSSIGSPEAEILRIEFSCTKGWIAQKWRAPSRGNSRTADAIEMKLGGHGKHINTSLPSKGEHCAMSRTGLKQVWKWCFYSSTFSGSAKLSFDSRQFLSRLHENPSRNLDEIRITVACRLGKRACQKWARSAEAFAHTNA